MNNNSRFGHDLLTRSCSIQLFYEGKPEDREFAGENPLRYAAGSHRNPRRVGWNQAGRPASQKRHRCELWAREIGGILECAGIPEFLDNADEVAASFSTELEELSALPKQ